jgi:hypothetical protein
MSTSASQQDCGLSGGTVSSRNLVYPGGIQIGSVHATGGKISHPKLVAKTTASTLSAGDLVNSLIVVSGNAGNLTLSIPTVEAILAEFALQSRTFAVGDSFEVTIAHGTAGAGDLILDAAVVGGEHSVTFASGLAPVNLTQAGGTLTHCAKLIFEVTSLATPSMRVSTIVG